MYELYVYIGSFHAWLENGGIPKSEDYIIQECGRGLIKLRRDTALGLLLFEAPPLLRSGSLDPVELNIIMNGLGIQKDDIVASAWCDNGVPWRGILMKSASEVLKLTPNASLLGDIDVGVIGRIDDMNINADYEVRAFCPMDSPFEDPVTGSLNAGLAHWLIGEGLIDIIPSTTDQSHGYIVRQGSAINRHGIVNIKSINNEIWVGGVCKTCIDGLVSFDHDV